MKNIALIILVTMIGFAASEKFNQPVDMTKTLGLADTNLEINW